MMKRRSQAILLLMTMPMLACNLPFLGGITEQEVATFAAGTVAAVYATRAAEPTSPAPGPTLEAATATPALETATPVPPTPTTGPAGCTDIATFVSDVTIPDNSPIEAGAGFVKTWRLRNTGTCTWTTLYALVFDHGDKMAGPDVSPLAGAVPPGSTVDLSVSLTAPAAPGTYQGYWKLRNNAGVLFGLGGSGAFFVKIVAPGTPTPTGFSLLPGVVLLIYVSSGTDMVLADSTCFDLDGGEAVGCGDADADFAYDVSIVFPAGTDEEIDPMNGAQFRFFGAGTPSGAECQAVTLGSGTFDANSTTYCYLTSGGKYGYLKVDSAGFVLQFDWGTYTFP